MTQVYELIDKKKKDMCKYKKSSRYHQNKSFRTARMLSYSKDVDIQLNAHEDFL